MQWYERVTGKLEKGIIYSRQDLISLLKNENDSLTEGGYNWIIHNMVRDGVLFHKGYNAYSLQDDKKLYEYTPLYSKRSKKLISLISNRFPLVRFTVFETTLLNEFINHLIAQNTILIQVEKSVSLFIFRFLQEENYEHILYKPTLNDLDVYWARDCIIVTDMISEAPINKQNSHAILLEKMLVDLITDSIISNFYSKAELPEMINNMKDRYSFDMAKALRYARRRNKEDLVKGYLKGE